MSSYNQVTEERTLAETLGLATREILTLCDEMADLCAYIAARFPNTYDKIAKYQQAYHALTALEDACTVLDEPLDRIDPENRRRPVTVTVGKQTRYKRDTSQRVRLGNAVVRLRGVTGALSDTEMWGGLREDLASNISALDDVTFPERFG